MYPCPTKGKTGGIVGTARDIMITQKDDFGSKSEDTITVTYFHASTLFCVFW